MTDQALLTAYQQTRSPDAFAQLVHTHIHLVYSVARRHVKDAHGAEDIAQEVFLTLAKKAPALDPSLPLAPWLFTTTRLLSLHSRRSAARRIHHETEAAMRQLPPSTPDPTWPLIAQDIDQAVADLPPTDRDALLLRFFASNSHPEIAATLAISEDAAKKRVQRALDALQKLLTSRGLAPTLSALSLAAALTTHAVHAAPPTLAPSITAALSTKIAATLTTKGTLMAAAKLKTTIIAASAVFAIAGTAGVAVYLASRDTPTVTASTSSVSPKTNEPTASATLTTAAAAASAAPVDFLTAYALPPGQVLAYIPNVNPAARTALYQQKSGVQPQYISNTPSGMVVQWKDDEISVWGMAFGGGFSLDSVLPSTLDIYAAEIASAYVMPAIPGDLVFRAGATEDGYLASLQNVLSKRFKKTISCSLESRPMDVVLLSGTYHFTSVPDAPPDRDIGHSVSFYIHALDSIDGAGGGSGNAREFGGTLSDYLGTPVVIDCHNFPKRISYLHNRDVAPRLLPGDAALFLSHIAEQTNLTVTHETRPVRCLVIKARTDRIPADEWQGYPKTSPFEAVRWNADTPEVQINHAWYELLSVDNVPTTRILAFAKQSDDQWKRRFEEDFIALLNLMGGDTTSNHGLLSLQLKNLSTLTTESLNVEPTQSNRDAIYKSRHP